MGLLVIISAQHFGCRVCARNGSGEILAELQSQHLNLPRSVLSHFAQANVGQVVARKKSDGPRSAKNRRTPMWAGLPGKTQSRKGLLALR